MTNKPPALVMGFDAEKRNLFMKLPTLIKWFCIPKEIYPSHPHTIVDEKSEMALLVFIDIGLNDQETHDFSEDFLRDWEIHMSPKTRGDYVDSTRPLLETLLE